MKDPAERVRDILELSPRVWGGDRSQILHPPYAQLLYTPLHNSVAELLKWPHAKFFLCKT